MSEQETKLTPYMEELLDCYPIAIIETYLDKRRAAALKLSQQYKEGTR